MQGYRSLIRHTNRLPGEKCYRKIKKYTQNTNLISEPQNGLQIIIEGQKSQDQDSNLVASEYGSLCCNILFNKADISSFNLNFAGDIWCQVLVASREEIETRMHTVPSGFQASNFIKRLRRSRAIRFNCFTP
jgi:hypothetical protein